MKLFIFFISSVIGGVLTAGVSPQAEVLGMQADLLLIVTLCCVMLEDSPMPIVFTSMVTVFIDLFYTGSIGIYTIPYAAVCLIAMWVLKNKKVDRVVVPVITCACAWVVKDVLCALTVFLDGNIFNFWKIFFTGTLPEMLFNSVIMLGIYQVYYMVFMSRRRNAPSGGRVEMPLRERRSRSLFRRSN